jgi:hypothetical protein
MITRCWCSAMRCVACGAELRFAQSRLDSTTLVSGDEHGRFLCSDCDRPLLVGPDSLLPSTPAGPVISDPPASLRPADVVSLPTALSPLVPSEEDHDFDECEVLLKGAIAMVRGAVPECRPAKSLTDSEAKARRPDGSLPVHSAPPTSSPASAETDSDLDECEALLKRAIEMVRGTTRWSQPTGGLTDRMPERSRASRVVKIHHDPVDATYVATDINSGLSVLRQQDRTRLRAMCGRIGWQVVEDAGLKAAD